MKNILKTCAAALLFGPLLLTGCNSAENTPDTSKFAPDFCLTDTLASMIKLDKAHLEPVKNQLQLSGKVTFDDQ